MRPCRRSGLRQRRRGPRLASIRTGSTSTTARPATTSNAVTPKSSLTRLSNGNLAALVLSHDAAVEADLTALLHRAQSAGMIDPAVAPEEGAHDGQPDQTERSTEVVQLIASRFLLATP